MGFPAADRQLLRRAFGRFAWLLGHAAHLFETDFDPKHPFCKLLVSVNARELVVHERREVARDEGEDPRAPDLE